ncbi:MAG: multidrug efflux pump subunit AcrA (membrane-fusion protein) [Saprospiraceae bacterium]|jgi:multidrug efflux pump subunit AcrA (membrane-fusion protein)
MEPHEKIHLHSEELREVLSTPPGRLARYGTMIAWFAFAALIGVAYFVKYPDIIEAPLVITAPNPPVNLIAVRLGLLEAVLVADDQQVNEGDLLIVYSSTANMLDIDTLEADLRYFSDEIYTSDLEKFTPRKDLRLGDLQDEYAKFLNNYDKFTYESVSNNDLKSINRLKKEIIDIQASIDEEEKTYDDIFKREDIAKKEMERLKKLYSSNVEKYGELYRQSVQKVKNFTKEYTDLASKIRDKNLEIKRHNKDIAEIYQESGRDNTNLIFDITENIGKLKGKIRSWKKDNLLFAPTEGRVIFYEEFDNVNQSVVEGTKILQIIPPGDIGEMYGRVNLPQNRSGKVDTGQVVIIKMKNYPFYEYGIVRGIIKSKSDIPQEDNTYKVEVRLPDGLRTSYGKNLNFSQGMLGSAEIITQERRFLYRIFDNVFKF